MADEPNNADVGHLMAHLREFSRRVKLSGTPEELESFGYLERQMTSYGYRTELLFHEAFISLPGQAKVEIDGVALRCITHSMAASSPPGGISGELVHVGEGTEADFSQAEVAGKIVVVDGIATEEVAALASAAGARGQLHISPTEHLHEMCVSPVWGNPSQHTRDQLPATVICSIGNHDGAALRQRLAAGQNVKTWLFAEVDTRWTKTPLLVAEMPAQGGAADDPFILLSGHHDTWHYGVMDNGGANATMLEAARLLGQTASSWKRGLRICFWSGHSHGRYCGSAWYADEYFDDLERRCAVHVNVDSTGGKGAAILSNSSVVDELRPLAAEAIEKITGQRHAGRRHGRAADQSFWGVGIPSMFGSLSHQPAGPAKMLTALGWWWHTPHDTIEHIDPDNLRRDTQIIIEVLERLLVSPVLPLDYTVYAASLEEELTRLRSAIGERLDLSSIAGEIAELRSNAQAVLAASDGCLKQAERLNAALMAASRQLVPLNYTHGDRFLHDRALPHPPWPALAGLRELAGLPKHASDTAFYVVHARQTRNRIAHALRNANAALRSAFDT
ncbi:peptidase M28 family protein (plasmid) [Rhizobium etli 8C-3]|uniref:PA domain-containing protein n=2 Tax=Rhizobium TaxID=379 RepID=A0A4R3R8N0_9HYPH|nr:MULTISPECIES: M28 family peptidase [Rhizobium]APO79899.1 peptidase M28 family protein [Rhizobium etli 8C-3]TCU30694.1 PA domain-containing protein [Rhizobium azibense]TCU41294.1 PA domain-containing protein [Rhizobium azibense]